MPAIPCPNCGELLELDDASSGERVECGACRHVFTAPAARPSSRRDEPGDRPSRRSAGRDPYGDEDDEDYRRRPPRPRRRASRNGTAGMGIASMVCGIVGLLGTCCCILFCALDVVAIVLGVMSLKTAGKGFGITGIVTGALGLLLFIGSIVANLVFGMGNFGRGFNGF